MAFLFWPASLLGVLLGYLGHGYRHVTLAAVGVVFSLPFLIYLAATPRFHFWAAGILLTNLASVLVLWKGRQRWALALFTAFPAFLAAVYAAVYFYDR